MAEAQAQVTRVLDAIGSGQAHAAEELLPLVYTELRRLAAVKMAHEPSGHTLQATALVHEAYLRLVLPEQQRQWHNRTHFFGAAAEAMRRILIENARRKKRAKRGGAWQRVEWVEADAVANTPEERLLLIDEYLDELERENPLEAQVVKLHYFTGLTLLEITDVLGVAEVTVRRRHAFAKAWLYNRIEGRGKKE
jgi:RNA polymerase sigma factor (TIGR02999 family)